MTSERAPKLTDEFIDTFLELAASTADDDAIEVAVRFWADQVDQQLVPTRVQPQSLTLAPSLFGGGQIHGNLAPVPFANVRTAVDAYTQDPDPTDAPYQRTLSERRADALDDLARYAITHDPDTDGEPDDGIDWDQLRADDTYDGTYPGDDLDQALETLTDDDTDGDGTDEDGGDGRLDPLVLLRRRLHRAEIHRRHRTVLPLPTSRPRRPRPTLRLPLLHQTTPPLRHPPPPRPSRRRPHHHRQRRAALPLPPPPRPPTRLGPLRRRQRPLGRRRPPRQPLDRKTNIGRTDERAIPGATNHPPRR